MSENNSLGDRIRKNSLSSSFNQKTESISTPNGVSSSSISTDIYDTPEDYPQGIFSKIAFPLSPLLTIVLCIAADFLLGAFFHRLKEEGIIEGYVDSWGEYIQTFTCLACFFFLRACLKKWKVKNNNGKTLFANIALIVCYFFILLHTWILITDLYLLITAA